MDPATLRERLAWYEQRTRNPTRHPRSVEVLGVLASHLEELREAGLSPVPLLMVLHDMAPDAWWDVEVEHQRERLEEEKRAALPAPPPFRRTR